MSEWHTKHTKADLAARIEELDNHCRDLEAKLAKAVEALEFWLTAKEPDIEEAINLMHATLEELKGELK